MFIEDNLRFWSGVALRQAGKSDEALAKFEPLLGKVDSLAGSTLTQKGGGASAVLEGQIDTSFYGAHYEAALGCESKGDKARARSLIKTLLKLGGQYPFWVDTMNGVNAQDRAAQLWDGSPWDGTAGLIDGSTEGDWRLPTKNELVSIAVGTEYIREYSMYLFTNVQSGNYGSSTAFSDMTDGAWYLFIHFATVGWDNKASVNYVWPVRGGH